MESKDANEADKAASRESDKWWTPTVKIPPGGLSDQTRKWIHHQKDAVNQVLKAAMAINAQVLSEMAIPESYIESLPKVFFWKVFDKSVYINKFCIIGKFH